MASICCTTGVPFGVRNVNVFGLSHAVDHGLGELGRARAAFREACECTTTVSAPALSASSLHQRQFASGVGREAVDRHDAWQPVLPNDVHVRGQVVGALRQRVEIFVPEPLNGLPPCDLVARTVVTSTAALGAKPPIRQTMSQNFWKPRSLANPASVTT